jgi:hypothetical protein
MSEMSGVGVPKLDRYMQIFLGLARALGYALRGSIDLETVETGKCQQQRTEPEELKRTCSPFIAFGFQFLGFGTFENHLKNLPLAGYFEGAVRSTKVLTVTDNLSVVGQRWCSPTVASDSSTHTAHANLEATYLTVPAL